MLIGAGDGKGDEGEEEVEVEEVDEVVIASV
jgi:hypothetical protein